MNADLSQLRLKIETCEEGLLHMESVHNWLKNEQLAGRTDEQDDRCIVTGERMITERRERLNRYRSELAEALA